MRRKETAWKKSRKFGDVKGGRKFPKITDNILTRFHSLERPTAWDELPIFFKDNPSRDFYFPVDENEITSKLNQLPKKDSDRITHIWLRKVKKKEYESGQYFEGMFICGSGVNLIILSAFSINLKMFFGKKKPSINLLKDYSNWCKNLNFDEKLKSWYLQWDKESIKDYYLNGLLLHEIGHYVESQKHRFWSKAKRNRRENFAETYAVFWRSKILEQNFRKSLEP